MAEHGLRHTPAKCVNSKGFRGFESHSLRHLISKKMEAGLAKKAFIVLGHGLVIWILCGATIGIGRSIFTMQTTLIIHAIGAPIFASLVSLLYFKKSHYTSPLQTAFIFLLFIIAMDVFLVAPVFEKSFAMFRSVLGTWIPFSLIFFATFFTGLLSEARPEK